jgi:mono/diheme cytochrome c family protein
MTLVQATEDLAAIGVEVYEDLCAQCHRSNGQGLPAKFPALDQNPFVLGDPQPVIKTVLEGRKGQMGTMPAWKDRMDDRQIAAALTYIRSAWKNKAPAVTPAMVKEVRGK